MRGYPLQFAEDDKGRGKGKAVEPAAKRKHSSVVDGKDYREAREDGDRLLLLEQDGELIGDADFRSFDTASAEYAIMIGARNLQGRGLGRKFTTMLHVWAFRGLGLDRVYVTILPTNRASVRLFERLGYGPDSSPRARDVIDEESDVTLSVQRSEFELQHGAVMDLARFRTRT